MSLWTDSLWQQFGASIDALDRALQECPDSLWNAQLWSQPPELAAFQGFSEFWYLAYHTLFWLDVYLYGSGEGFVPPAPFDLNETDPEGKLPERVFTKNELRNYLAQLRGKCQTALEGMTEETAGESISFPWTRGQPISYYELQIYSMRHVQEHASQLHLFLGQQTRIERNTWVARAQSGQTSS